MILRILGADFSSANIGTLSTYVISKSIGAGISHNIPNFVDKNSSVTWTLTVEEGYLLGSYSIIMNGETITPVVNENTMTITIPSVTGNVRIVITSINENTGGGSGETTTYPTIDIEVGTINAPDGNDGNVTNSRWRSISYTDISNTSSTICLTGCKYIISCYDSNKNYLGQKSASDATLIKGSGQWLESGTVVNISELKNNSVIFVRFVLQSGTGISIKLDGVECFGKLTGSGSGSTNYEDFELNYPFEYGSIVKEDGKEMVISDNRRVRTDFISVETLSPNFTVKETRYLVCCYGESNTYLGQYNGTDIISGDVITAPQWINQGVVTTTNNLVSLGVKNIRIVGETGTLLPFVYVNDIKMTKPE